MKNMNRNNIQETLRVTCRHITAMLLAVVLLTGIAAAENSRKMVWVTWGGEQEVIEEQVQEEKDKALTKLDNSGPMAPGQAMAVRNDNGKWLTGQTMCEIITDLKELKEMMVAVGYPKPGKLFDEWNAVNMSICYDCVSTGEYHLDSSENKYGFITEKYSIDPADRFLSSYWVEVEKDGRKCSLLSWLSGGSEYSIQYEQDKVPQVEEVSIPGMEKAMYICKPGGSSSIIMCRPLESEISYRISPAKHGMDFDTGIYAYEFLEFENMTPEEVTEFFAE